MNRLFFGVFSSFSLFFALFSSDFLLAPPLTSPLTLIIARFHIITRILSGRSPAPGKTKKDSPGENTRRKTGSPGDKKKTVPW